MKQFYLFIGIMFCGLLVYSQFETSKRKNKGGQEIEKQYENFKLSEALMTVYRLFKDEFSSWLLEIIKPDYQKPVDALTYAKVIDILDNLLRVLHPFMPFITEELWQNIKERKAGESIMITEMPEPVNFDKNLKNNFELIKEIITQIRNIRKEKNPWNKIEEKSVVVLILTGAGIKTTTSYLPFSTLTCGLDNLSSCLIENL